MLLSEKRVNMDFLSLWKNILWSLVLYSGSDGGQDRNRLLEAFFNISQKIDSSCPLGLSSEFLIIQPHAVNIAALGPIGRGGAECWPWADEWVGGGRVASAPMTSL